METGNSPETGTRKPRRLPLVLMIVPIAAILLGLAIGYGFSGSGPASGLIAAATIFNGPNAQGNTSLAVASDTATPTARPANGAWAQVSPEKWDFGQVDVTDVVTHSFQLKNAGNADLIITKVTTSCGCTSATVGSKLLKPGESTILAVTYEPAHHGTTGPVLRLVYVDSNDPVTPELKIPVTADVVKRDGSPTATSTPATTAQLGR